MVCRHSRLAITVDYVAGASTTLAVAKPAIFTLVSRPVCLDLQALSVSHRHMRKDVLGDERHARALVSTFSAKL